MAIQDVVEPAMVVGVSGIYGSYLLCVEYLQISFALQSSCTFATTLTVRGTAPSGVSFGGRDDAFAASPARALLDVVQCSSLAAPPPPRSSGTAFFRREYTSTRTKAGISESCHSFLARQPLAAACAGPVAAGAA